MPPLGRAQAARATSAASGRGNAARAAVKKHRQGSKDQLGSLRLRLPGASVAPPRIPGDLAERHDWLMDNPAVLRGKAGEIVVTLCGTPQQNRAGDGGR